jgi:hypothetical protein
MYNPGPACTSNPSGIPLPWTTKSLISEDRFTIAVHIAAAISNKTVPRMAKDVERRKV